MLETRREAPSSLDFCQATGNVTGVFRITPKSKALLVYFQKKSPSSCRKRLRACCTPTLNWFRLPGLSPAWPRLENALTRKAPEGDVATRRFSLYGVSMVCA